MLFRTLLLKYESCLFSQHLAFCHPLKQLLVSGRFVGRLCVYIWPRFSLRNLELAGSTVCWLCSLVYSWSVRVFRHTEMSVLARTVLFHCLTSISSPFPLLHWKVEQRIRGLVPTWCQWLEVCALGLLRWLNGSLRKRLKPTAIVYLFG